MSILKENKNKIRTDIRNRMRKKRNNLTQQEQNLSSQKITHYIIHDHRVRSAKNIGIFINFDGEIKTNYLIKILLYAGKKIYLPILNPYKNSKTLLFSEYKSSRYLILNKLNIYEPILNQISLIKIQELDILFIPLVSFDKNGNRLGMGGGFYDYTFKTWIYNTQNSLIGLAYDCQQNKRNIPIENWDVPLQEIITPSSHWIWKNKAIIRKIKHSK